MKKVVVVIPCHNEEEGIARVLKAIPHKHMEKLGLHIQALVIDNNSTDKTAEVARKAGAIVIPEKRKGKGNAMRAGFNAIEDDVDYVIMLDGDNTYRPSEMHRMLEPLLSDFCDVVVGSRIGGKLSDGSLTYLNRLGNWIYTFFVRLVYRANVTDVLSGYFAWKKEAIDDLAPHIKSDGFAIEMEMIIKMEKLGHEVYSVPITYDQRAGESKLSRFKDGAKIVHMFLTGIFWKPPKQSLAMEGKED